MKILYLVDYFYPFVHGGAEISVFGMAKALVHQGQQLYVLTPNYGSAANELIDGIHIHRYPFIKKLTDHSDQLTNAWHFNPVYWLLLSSAIFFAVRRNKVEILHCQSASTVIPAVVMGKILRIPVVLTFRDAQILCNYGLCLTTNQYGNTCNLITYFTQDFRHYYSQIAGRNNLSTLFVQILFAIVGRIRTMTLRYFSKFATVKIVSSTSAKKTFEANNFNELTVIHNLYHFSPKIKPSKIQNTKILYATKLSQGKGLDLLLTAFTVVIKEFPKLRLQIVGGGDIEKYKLQSKKLGIGGSVDFFGRLDNPEVLEMRKSCLLEVAPSIYLESFGRTALEALGSGLPIVVSNRGGFTDIVENDITGFIIEPTVHNLASAITQTIKQNQRLRVNIKKNYPKLKKKFETDPIEQQLKLYRNLI